MFRSEVTQSFKYADRMLPLQAPVRGDKGVDMCLHRLTMEEDAVSGPTLEGGSSGDSNGFAGAVANPHHDL